MKDLNNKVAVVTGAASGIGRALALQLSDQGCSLAIADINIDGLEETAEMIKKSGGSLTLHELDISKSEDIYSFAENIVKEHDHVDLVINNAGVSHMGDLLTSKIEDFEWIFNINFWGVAHGCKAFLPHLNERPDSVLVNISSLFGLVGVASQTAYCATKFAVRGFTESLRLELQRSGSPVSVISVHPGGIKTNIARNARISKEGLDNEKFAKFFDKIAKTTPEEAAAVIIRGIRKNKNRVLIGRDAKIADMIQRKFPVSYDRVFSKIM